TVNANLPSELQQGLFAEPREYPVIVRFSTSPGDVLSDAVSTPRGIAIKVLDVAGERLAGDTEQNTQDFLMVDGPAFLAPGPKKFLASLKTLAGTTDKAPGLKRALSFALRGVEGALEAVGGKSPTLTALGGHRLSSILIETYFSQVPILFGPYMAKLSLTPVSSNLTALKEKKLDVHNDNDAIRSDVVEFFRLNEAQWDLRAQLCTNLDRMPIEDASVVWPDDESPFRSIAQLRIAPQNAWSPERSKAVDDGMSFNPWHCLAAHRPLGAIMRARRAAYAASVEHRFALNRCPYHQPSKLTKA
ncbi:MAG TPA: catalase family protein, partial [Rudaea sp.]|nr:catalase family protein [Rudaea sp.]